MWTLGCMKATPISGKGLLSHMMLLKLGLGLGLLTGVSSSEAANPACNLCWHFWFRSCVLQPWIFLVAAASTPKAAEGQRQTWHLLCSHTSSQRFQEQNPGPRASLLFAPRGKSGQRLCQTQLLCPAASPQSSSKEVSVHCGLSMGSKCS